MGDHTSSDSSWKKMVIAKANNEWVSTIKREINEEEAVIEDQLVSNQSNFHNIKSEQDVISQNTPEPMLQEVDPLLVISEPRRRRKGSGPKNETPDERKERLAKMSAYAAQRLANETPMQRANRLKRMSEYAAKRLAEETHEQRARRLARMSAYAAKRLAEESPQQRQIRLARMSAYAAKRKHSSS